MKKKHAEWISQLDDITEDLRDLRNELEPDDDDEESAIYDQVDNSVIALTNVKDFLIQQKKDLSGVRLKKDKTLTQRQTFNAVKRVQRWAETHEDDGLAEDLKILLHSPHISISITGEDT